MIETLRFSQTRKGDNLTLQELWNGAEAVLFDFDGVLADSEPLFRKSWNLVFQEFGHTVPEKAYWKHWAFFGEGLAGEIKRTGLHISSRESVRSKQKKFYADFCRNGEVILFPEAAEVVHTASSMKKCVIASNTDSSQIQLILQNQMKTPPAVVGGEGLRPKPFPDIFLKAAEFLSVEPSRCLVFEDAWKGVKAAESAGMPVVLVRNRYNAGFSAPEASCEISGLGELNSFLKGVNHW